MAEAPRDPARAVPGARVLTDLDRPEDKPVNEREYMPGGGLISVQEKEAEFVQQMERRMAEAYNWWFHTFEKGQRDVHRTYIDQWPESARREREAKNRPALSINSLPQYINQVLSSIHQSDLSVRFVHDGGLEGPMVGAFDKQVKFSSAHVLTGIAKSLEVRSDATTKYARAGQHAIEAGIGWVLLELRPDETDPFYKHIWINHVRNRWSVLVDPGFSEPNMHDIDYAFVHELMPLHEFNARYPEYMQEHGHPLEMYGGFATAGFQGNDQWWGNENGVRVFDYYYKVAVKKEWIELIQPETRRRIVNRTETIGQYVDELVEEHGFEVTRRGKFDCREVRVVRAIRGKLLSDEYVWPGSRIPLVPCVGRQVDLFDKTEFLGLLHWAIEPTQMKDAWISAATERVAQLPKDPWLVTSEQIANTKGQWDSLSTSNPAYLEYEHLDGSPPPFKQPSRGDMPMAEIQMIEVLRGAIQEAIGIYEANLGQRSNERSGAAIERRQEAGIGATFGFIYNVSMMVRGVGEQLRELIPVVYGDDRLMTIITDEGEEVQFHLNHYITDTESGQKFLYGALSLTQYNVRVTVGPSSDTQRNQFTTVVEAIFQNQPQIAAVAGDLFVKALNLPYGEAIVRRLRANLPAEFLTMEERENKPPREPTPEENLQALKLEAERVKAEGDIELMRLKIDHLKKQLNTASLEAMMGEDGEQDETKLVAIVRREIAAAKRQDRGR